jgi:plastocyanin
MRRVLVMVSAAAVLAVAAAAAPAATPRRTVSVGDNFFAPGKLTVAKGTRVTWRWTGGDDHDVHAVSGPATFRSAIKSSGTFAKTLTRRGTYKLRCDLHKDKMRMTIVVG